MDEQSSTMQWFGQRYDAPAWKYMTQTATPVGMRCSHCTERVDEGDAGVVMPHWHEVGTVYEPVHVECFLRSMHGSVAHLEGREEAHEGTWREQGRQVLAWLQRR